MRGLSRLVLIALLALLLPLKGMAAGGFMHLAGSGPYGLGLAHGSTDGSADSSAERPPCHSAQAEAEAEAEPGAADPGPSAGTCKHCAPCCIAVAPMWALPTTAALLDREPTPAARPLLWARLALALPDRPPRAT